MWGIYKEISMEHHQKAYVLLDAIIIIYTRIEENEWLSARYSRPIVSRKVV